MNPQPKPSAGALRAAKIAIRDDALLTNELAEIIDQESGLIELIRSVQGIEDILCREQPGMPPLPKQWADLFKRHCHIALTKATNPNATVQQAFVPREKYETGNF